ncbi:MAG: hypothetical protein EA424_02815, partial [Planctomycetaceae bacterium]
WIFGDRPEFLSDETSLVQHVPHEYVTRVGKFRMPVTNFFLEKCTSYRLEARFRHGPTRIASFCRGSGSIKRRSSERSARKYDRIVQIGTRLFSVSPVEKSVMGFTARRDFLRTGLAACAVLAVPTAARTDNSG